MNTKLAFKESLIRSRALAVMVTILAIVLFQPLSVSAAGKQSPESNHIYMYAFKQKAYASVIVSKNNSNVGSLLIESSDGGYVYYTKRLVGSDNYSNLYDFSNLDDGEYSVRVKSGGEVAEKEFMVEDGVVSIKKEQPVVPTFKPTESGLTVLFDKALQSSVAITVYDSKGKEVTSKYWNKNLKNKKLDFSKVYKGKYKVVVDTGNKLYAFDYLNE